MKHQDTKGSKRKKPTCGWPGDNEQMIAYHDSEWGVPVHDDRKLFEFLVLDAFQAGLSWAIILKKREGFRKAFADFDAAKVARFTPKRVEKLLLDPGIVRNRLKVESTVENARRFLEVQREFGSFDRYIWQFTGGKMKVNRWRELRQIPATSPESDAMSKDLKKRGFRFCGSTICYAFMQAAGMVNDHLVSCFRYREVQRTGRTTETQRRKSVGRKDGRGSHEDTKSTKVRAGRTAKNAKAGRVTTTETQSRKSGGRTAGRGSKHQDAKNTRKAGRRTTETRRRRERTEDKDEG